MPERLQTGVPGLDELLGGGLLPGTLTVVLGATGIGKTQLGVQFAHAGGRQEKAQGVIFDLASRGDPQNHAPYAERMFRWILRETDAERTPSLDSYFDNLAERADCLRMFAYSGRRVTKQDLDWDQWRNWQAELNSRLRSLISFLYGNLVGGVRRVVIDGVEPVDRPHDSIQFQIFEYAYHQVVRKDPEWVARDLFRERYREYAEAAAARSYDPAEVGCLLLLTSREILLEELMARPLDEGDLLANANTVLCLGKIRDGDRMARGLYVAKHRGSACSDAIARYEIGEHGLKIVGR